MSDLTPYNNESPKKNLLFVTQLVYILHGLSIVIGLMTGATIISAFLFGWPSIAAVFFHYIFASGGRGAFFLSHFFLPIRTFLVWIILSGFVAIVGVLLTPFVIGPFIWLIGFVVLGIWVAYRIVVGWLRLRQYRPVFSGY